MHKLLINISMACLFVLFGQVVAPCHSATITLSDETAIEAKSFSFDGKQAELLVGTETQVIPRELIRNIRFSQMQDRSLQLSSDTADLIAMMARAHEIIASHPDSRTVQVLNEGSYNHRNDGTNFSRYRSVMYLAKEESLGNSEISLTFDPNRERIRIIHARTLTPEGVVHSITPEEIRITKGSSGGVDFDQTQELSFTIPQANVGCLIDYSFEFEEFNPFDKNLFQGRFSFQGGSPVGECVLRVRIPKNKDLYYVTPNFSSDKAVPVISEDADSKLYKWSMSDVAPIIGEPYMPAYRDILPMVFYSLQKDWTYMFTRMKPMFEKRFALTDEVRKKVDEIVEGAGSLKEKIARIYLFCQKEIRYISIKGNLASDQVGHPAEETLRNRYGDCTDKAMLLATMLKHIGVTAYPVGLRTNTAGKAVRELPIFDANHAITEVHLDGRVFYLDSTATDYRYPYFRPDDHDTIVDNAMLETLSPVPLPPPEDNAVIMSRQITLSSDGTTRIEFESEQNGAAEADFRYSARNMKPEEYENQTRASIAALTADYNLELATYSDPLDFNVPFKALSTYTLNRYAPRSGSFMIFEIPFFRLNFSEVSLKKRKYDIVYTTSRLRIEKIAIQIPDGFTVKYLPPPLRIQSAYVEFEVIYDLQGSAINVSRKLAFPRRVIPVADYRTYKENLEKIARSTEERIFLEKTAKGNETL